MSDGPLGEWKCGNSTQRGETGWCLRLSREGASIDMNVFVWVLFLSRFDSVQSHLIVGVNDLRHQPKP